MALSEPILTAEVDDSNRWALMTLTATGMTRATVYRLGESGATAVRGAYNIEALGSAVVVDYEAPQGVPLRYYASVTDGTQTRESVVVQATGQISRGGDVVFGLDNPLSWVPVHVVSFPQLKSDTRRSVINVAGRKDPVVVSDVRSMPSGTLTLATTDSGVRRDLSQLLETSSIIAFSPGDPTYGFEDIWYLSVGSVSENRLTTIGSEQARTFTLEVQRVLPPPADFIGPALLTWQQVYDAGTSWTTGVTLGKNWLTVQIG